MEKLNSAQIEILQLFEGQTQTAEDLMELRKVLVDYQKNKNKTQTQSIERQIIRKVKEKVLAIDSGAKITLFGSRARGDARKDSDWDFLILMDSPVNFHLKNKLRNELYDIELETGEIIGTIIENKEDWDRKIVTDIHKNIAKEGIAI
jgi:uncharacterized protein